MTVAGWSATATVDSTGRAWVRLPASIRPGAHAVTMAYSGTAITLPSTTTQSIGVRRVAPTVRTTASGVAYRGYATVHVSVSAKLPASGRVALYAGYYKVGSATLRKSHGHWVATIHTRRILSTGTLALRYGGNHDVAPVLHKVGTVKRTR
ncbi:hypothetical protein [Cellulomonas alba]|uniref:Bacterial Ig-like domain-containing protein n=1 Tax=Cellulomonas alba TaxID=3053467 RepID=A0ABT7SEA5_9CELL|nr:hypothetical protein [Cellulomonas alba]MDM7854531.1 hypothetical protein [Cellulomonas alba]